MAAADRSSRVARVVFFAASAAGLVTALVLGAGVLLPFLLALVVAYVLFPAVQVVARLRVPRWIAIILVYTVTLGAAVGFGWATVPRLVQETKKLTVELPKLVQKGREVWLPALDATLARWARQGAEPEPAAVAQPPSDEGPAVVVVPRPGPEGGYELRLREDLQLRQVADGAWAVGSSRGPAPRFSSARALEDAFDQGLDYAQRNAGALLGMLRHFVGSLSRGIFYLFLTLMLAGYLMHTYERIQGFIRQLWPADMHPSFDRFVQRLDRSMAGVVRGQLLICVVNGVLSAIGFWLFGVKYWPILALVAAVLSIIPIFGSILSSIPAVAIGLTQGLGTAIAVLAWIVGIHQLEANFLNPKIIGDAAKIHPVLVVFSLLVGEHLFGIVGALLAVPSLAIIQTVFLHFRESVLGIPVPYEQAAAGAPPSPSSEAAGSG